MDYVHVNSARIADRVRRVLRVPADDARQMLDRSVRDLGQRREEMIKLDDESNAALRYFRNLVRIGTNEEDAVKAMNLEAPPQALE